MKDQLEKVINKIKNPLSLDKAVYLCSEVLSDITTVLNIITICPGSGALVERGFSLMNLIMNDLRSSINIRTIDITMRIHYNDADLSEEETDTIINVWKRINYELI